MKKLKPPGSGENIIKKQPETGHPFHSAKNTAQLKNLTYDEFKKIAGKTPFTLAEWASILHEVKGHCSDMQKTTALFRL